MEESSSSSSSSSSSVGTAATIQNNTTNSKKHNNAITGSFILSQAFRMFQEGQEKGDNSNLTPVVFHGAMDRKIRVVAGSGLNTNNITDTNSSENEIKKNKNNLVMSIFSSEQEKETEFKKMGVTTLAEENNSMEEEGEEAERCLDELYHRS